MAAVLHLVDQRRLIDSNGISDGATLTFYLTGTTTLATIYSDVGLTTPITNPVVVGAGAAVPTFYLDGDVTYKRVITYADGSTDQTDPYTLPDYLSQAGTAATSAAASAAAALVSETNAAAAEDAVTAAFLNGDAFTDTTVAAAITAGLAAVADGEYFIATGDDIDEVRQYKDVAGVATLIFSVPKLSAVTDAVDAAEAVVADFVASASSSYGPNGLPTSGDGTFSSSRTTAFFQAPHDLSITKFGVAITTLGNGSLRIERATGTFPNLTLDGAPVAFTAAGTGVTYWNAPADFTAIDLAAGEWLVVHQLASGPTLASLNFVGNTLNYTSVDLTGAVTFGSTVSNRILGAMVGYTFTETAIATDALAEGGAIAALLDGQATAYTDIGIGADTTGSLTQAALRITELGQNDTSETVEVLEVEVDIKTLGSGIARLFKGTRSGVSVTPTSHTFTLTTAVGTGKKVWTKAAGDFGGIFLAPDEYLYILSPSGGIELGFEVVSGSTLTFRTAVTIDATYNYSQSAGRALCARMRHSGVDLGLTSAAFDEATGAAISAIVQADAPTQWDIFLIAGQSNAEGRGEARTSEYVAPGWLKVWNGSAFVASTGDPIGGATTGSAWPAFVNRYRQKTGRGVLLVEQATGGTAVTNNGANNWSSSGALRGAAATAYEAAYAQAITDGLAVRKAGVLWIQGEADAGYIDAATITQATFYTAMETLLAYFEAQFGYDNDLMPFIMCQTGTLNTGDTTGHQQVRAAQEELARKHAGVKLAHFGAKNFPARSLMVDTEHYTQAGYNEIGKAMGDVAALAA